LDTTSDISQQLRQIEGIFGRFAEQDTRTCRYPKD
jgi:hypothetical protein